MNRRKSGGNTQMMRQYEMFELEFAEKEPEHFEGIIVKLEKMGIRCIQLATYDVYYVLMEKTF